MAQKKESSEPFFIRTIFYLPLNNQLFGYSLVIFNQGNQVNAAIEGTARKIN